MMGYKREEAFFSYFISTLAIKKLKVIFNPNKDPKVRKYSYLICDDLEVG